MMDHFFAYEMALYEIQEALAYRRQSELKRQARAEWWRNNGPRLKQVLCVLAGLAIGAAAAFIYRGL